jgi:hypothetical protein
VNTTADTADSGDTADNWTHPAPGAELICTTALCRQPAAARVSWRMQPQALPVCRGCAARLAAHGDTVLPLLPVLPLPSDDSLARADRVA